MICAPSQQGARTPGIWNPLPYFTTVQHNGQIGKITASNFFRRPAAGTLPAVSWVKPDRSVSEHPPGLISAGQTYVTSSSTQS